MRRSWKVLYAQTPVFMTTLVENIKMSDKQ